MIRIKTFFKIVKRWIIVPEMLLIASCISEPIDDTPSGSKLNIGDSIPDFEIKLSNGTNLCTNDLIGKNCLLTFFHTQCSDCQKELPIINEVYLAHQQDTTWHFLCISRAEEYQSVNRFWQQHNLSLPYSAQPNDQIYRLFAYNTVPLIYVIDKEGIIRAIYTDNPLASREELEQWFIDTKKAFYLD